MSGSRDLECELLERLIRRTATAGPIPRDIIIEFTPLGDTDGNVANNALDSLLDEPFVHNNSSGIQIDKDDGDLISYARSNCPDVLELLQRNP